MAGSGTTHVVVCGGGFAGVSCARRLAGDPRVRVTLLDQTGNHQFQPLLYQVATAELAPADMCFDLARMFRHHERVAVRTAEATAVDPATRTVTLAGGGSVTGDYLVLAAGCQPNYFHTPGAAEHAFPLYRLDGAEAIRTRLLSLFADTAAKPELVDEGALTFVVVGSGPTGVEAAGALADLVNDVLPHAYQGLAVSAARIILVDHGHTVLPAFSAQAHAYAANQLERRGVQLRLGVAATEIGPGHATLGDGTTIPTRLVVWAGGEMAAPLAGRAGVSVGRGGRIDANPDLTVPGFPALYAVGDLANLPAPAGAGGMLPQLGSVAHQSGDWAARNILAELAGAPRQAFHYHDKGIMAMIGRQAAVAEIGSHRHELHGRLAFAAWLGVHAELLANAEAELKAFLAWANEFYLRPHHRSAQLREPSQVDRPRIDWSAR
jgi:NADH dehydrogenase